ncbi:kinase-like domain-containing protein [Rhizophagus clarus]|uniref:Kinase-like domain-containing protein n=1 Tax=Rhizophagus clarus TaxID=94130 RepID=A0A8H3QN07_9GLOM|nr:kinase-like domain-containing protein [Rhizophagus clarus]
MHAVTRGADAVDASEDVVKLTAELIIDMLGTVTEAIKSISPILTVVISLINEIKKNQDNAQYNKKICDSLFDRVISAKAAAKIIEQRIKESDEKVHTLVYQKNSILGKLHEIFKWVEMGNLKEVYEEHDIPWDI